MYGNIVIAADGVNSLLSKKAGLHGELAANHVALAVKEIVNMTREKIEDRFLLNPNEGATIELFGDSTMGMLGYGFIYTNRDSLSVGVGALLSDFIKKKVTPNDLMERFKKHPMLQKLLEGGESKEYMAHLIPEGGAAAIKSAATSVSVAATIPGTIPRNAGRTRKCARKGDDMQPPDSNEQHHACGMRDGGGLSDLED